MEIDQKIAEQYKRFGYAPKTYGEAHFKMPCSCCDPDNKSVSEHNFCRHPKVTASGSTYEYYYGDLLVCVLTFTSNGYVLHQHPEGVVEALEI